MIETKTERGQQTRERLLEAALQLFAQHGYHGASMRQIAEAAEMAVGGIYNHFRSKEEILTAVILAWHPLDLLLSALVETEGQTLEEFIRNAVHRFLDTFAARPELLRIFMIELFEFDGAHMPHFFELVGDKVMLIHARLTALDARLQALSPLTFARIFLGSVLGFYISGRLLSKLPTPYANQIGAPDDLVQLLIVGLTAPGGALVCGDNDDDTTMATITR